MKTLFCTTLLTLLVSTLQAQVKIGNNPTTINAGSVLEVESTNKGLLYPRVSLAATNAWGLAGSAAAGMSVYNTNASITGTTTYPTTGAGLYYFDGTGWVSNNGIAGSATTEPWYNVATNLGATANTQNIYQMGNVGIGTSTPSARLQVVGVSGSNAMNITPAANQYGMSMTTVATAGQSFGATIAAGTNTSDASFYVRNAAGTTPYLMVRGDGNVGIGTAGPGAKLEVVSAATGVNTVIVRSSGVNSNGIYSEATGGGGSAGYFNATGTSTGIAAYSVSGLAIYGQSSNTHGIYGKTLASGFGGVIGVTTNNLIYGMLGVNNQYSFYGNGDMFITGNLAKGSGTFKIDHPQDPANKYLIHSFVESPDMMNVYNGNIVTDANGDATVKLPDYFLSLNKEFRYQLTAIGTFAQAIVAEEVNTANEFKVKTDKPNVKISWQVTGIRRDAYANAHRIKDVVEKKGDEKGKYIHPELFNQPATKGIFYKQTNTPVDIKKEN
jgi:hypothetical protein